MDVKGTRTVAERLSGDEEAGQQEDRTEELAQLEPLGRAEAIEAVGHGRDEGTEGDEDAWPAHGCGCSPSGVPGRRRAGTPRS